MLKFLQRLIEKTTPKPDDRPKTQYRIIHKDIHTCTLQYSFEDVWYTIPPADVAHLNYNWQPGQTCIFTVHSYNDEDELKSFAAAWPHIEDYFASMREDQAAWRKKMSAINRDTKYL